MTGARRRSSGERRGRHRPPKDLRIAWANVGKRPPAHTTLMQKCYEHKIDVIQVQEPWTARGTTTNTHPGYDTYAPIDSWDSPDN